MKTVLVLCDDRQVHHVFIVPARLRKFDIRRSLADLAEYYNQQLIEVEVTKCETEARVERRIRELNDDWPPKDIGDDK